jgi:hypothetical protein
MRLTMRGSAVNSEAGRTDPSAQLERARGASKAFTAEKMRSLPAGSEKSAENTDRLFVLIDERHSSIGSLGTSRS